ncbi:MAG: VIT domain-containing protein [Opitutaceae bacterium]
MTSTELQTTTARPFGTGRTISHLLFGVILPAFTLGFEIVTGFSAEIYINPIPTPLHAVAVGMIPLLILFTIVRLARGTAISRIDFHLNSLCLAITTAYALAYLPISPFACVGIIVYGLGFLPLSPIIAFYSAYRLRKELKRRIPPEQAPTRAQFFIGFGIGIALLAVTMVPKVITEYGIAQYADSGANNQNNAVRLLRTFGSDQVLLDACYGDRQTTLFRGQSTNRISTEKARELFYRVNGESFNEHRRARNRLLPEVRSSTWDRDLGGEHVGQRIDEIQLEESRLDGILDPAFGVGYVEWTMVFRNSDRWRDHEARMLISMPKGAVASRVTLWVNGEPREAAFGSKAKVRAAYQAVAVRQRRDPILVNWAGPDLLLAQCFPIPADGGSMKVRIGMSFPLEATEGALGFRDPSIVAENFVMEDEFKHSVWYEEKTTDGVISHPVVDLSNDELVRHSGKTLTDTTLSFASFTSSHPTDDQLTQVLKASLPAEAQSLAPKAVVIDGSVRMKAQADKIAKWISRHAGTTDLYFASDKVHHFQGNGAACADWIRGRKFTGGQDNVPALVEAARKLQGNASAENPQSIYWFSGPQPIQLSGTEPIRQLFERRPLHLDIIACLTTRDYNALYELAPLNYSETRYLDDDGNLMESIIGFEQIENAPSAQKGSSHPHRLKIAQSIRQQANHTYRQQAKLGSASFKAKIAELANEAAAAYLVTQLSGAVVLETDRQYKENDLEAGDPNSVPTVPETKHYALILGLCSLAWVAVQRRRFRNTAVHHNS